MNNETVMIEGDWPSFSIATYPEKEDIPALHIHYDDDEFPDSLIMLTENKFYGDKSLELELTADDLSKIDRILREQSDDDPSMSRWQYMCKDWNTHAKTKVVFPETQPDYRTMSDTLFTGNIQM